MQVGEVCTYVCMYLIYIVGLRGPAYVAFGIPFVHLVDTLATIIAKPIRLYDIPKG